MCLYDFECENEHTDWNIDVKLVYKTKSVLVLPRCYNGDDVHSVQYETPLPFYVCLLNNFITFVYFFPRTACNTIIVIPIKFLQASLCLTESTLASPSLQPNHSVRIKPTATPPKAVSLSRVLEPRDGGAFGIWPRSSGGTQVRSPAGSVQTCCADFWPPIKHCRQPYNSDENAQPKLETAVDEGRNSTSLLVQRTGILVHCQPGSGHLSFDSRATRQSNSNHLSFGLAST